MDRLFGPVFDVMQRALSLRIKRQSVISSNLANVDTPGYREKDVNFKRLMESYMDEKYPNKVPGESDTSDIALRVTNKRHIEPDGDSPIPVIIESKERGVPNNVDLDEQMAKLAENNIQYQIVTEMLSKKLELIKNAIIEGGRQ